MRGFHYVCIATVVLFACGDNIVPHPVVVTRVAKSSYAAGGSPGCQVTEFKTLVRDLVARGRRGVVAGGNTAARRAGMDCPRGG